MDCCENDVNIEEIRSKLARKLFFIVRSFLSDVINGYFVAKLVD